MRHGKKVNHLGRKVGHRHALMKNLAQALIQHKRINTTLAKAKALRVYIEPLVTKAKTNTTHSRRVVFTYLQSKEAIKELFGPIAEKVGDRPGGYVRVIKTGFRQGDSAEMAMIEFVDFNEVYSSKEEEKGGGRRRRRRKSGGGGASQVAETREVAAKTVEAEEDIAEDEITEVEEIVEKVEDTVTEAADETSAENSEEKKTEE